MVGDATNGSTYSHTHFLDPPSFSHFFFYNHTASISRMHNLPLFGFLYAYAVLSSRSFSLRLHTLGIPPKRSLYKRIAVSLQQIFATRIGTGTRNRRIIWIRACRTPSKGTRIRRDCGQCSSGPVGMLLEIRNRCVTALHVARSQACSFERQPHWIKEKDVFCARTPGRGCQAGGQALFRLLPLTTRATAVILFRCGDFLNKHDRAPSDETSEIAAPALALPFRVKLPEFALETRIHIT